MAEPRKQIDWEKVEAEYRAGIKSLREIGAEFGVSHVAVDKKAKRQGWVRDLSAKIKAKADALVNRAGVNRAVNGASENDIVDSNAQAILNVRLSHRANIRKTKCLVERLLDEVDGANTEGEARGSKERLSIPQRVDCVRKLTDSTKTLIGLEREAWGIGTGADDSMKPSANVYCGLPSHVLEMIGK